MNDGLSYFGVFRETFVPYAIGLLGAAYFAMQASEQIPDHESTIRPALKTYAILVLGIVVTPYAASPWLNYLHIASGSALYSLQLIFSIWLTMRLHFVRWSVTLLLSELIAGILCAYYLGPPHGLLPQMQTLFQFAFGILLSLSLMRLIHEPVPAQLHHARHAASSR